MKKKILYMAAIIICLSIVAGGTLSYFTTEDTARNVITSGGIDIRLVEQQLVDGTLQPYPNQPLRIMPGETVSKVVTVQNTEQAAWIRMKYAISVYDAEGMQMEIPAAELERAIIITPDTQNWVLKEGWWYYNAAVQPGEMAKPLFETVSFSGSHMDNEYQNCKVEIDVLAQAVQQANNGSNVMEAAGWPEA